MHICIRKIYFFDSCQPSTDILQSCKPLLSRLLFFIFCHSFYFFYYKVWIQPSPCVSSPFLSNVTRVLRRAQFDREKPGVRPSISFFAAPYNRKTFNFDVPFRARLHETLGPKWTQVGLKSQTALKSFRLHGNFTASNHEISNRLQKLFLSHGDFTAATFQTIVRLYWTCANDIFRLMQT